MLLEELSWMDVERYLERDDRVVVITGSCEQHGYLSLLTDTLVPLEVAREACRREKALIAPPLPYGISPYFAAYPGTLSLSLETFVALAREVIEGLLAQGFRRVLVSNGHGGNSGLLGPLLIEMNSAHPDAHFDLFQWYRHPAVEAAAQEANLPQYHANYSELFPFTKVGSVPEGEKEPAAIPRVASAADFRAVLGDGSFGGAYQAPQEVMDRLFQAAVEAMVAALREI